MAVFQATATAPDTIASATSALLDSMTLTPGAGDYILSFTSSAECSSESRIIFQVYVNDNLITYTERVMFQETSIIASPQQVQIYAYLPGVGASEAVEIRWNRDTAGTATCYERTLTLQEVDSADIDQATATNTINTSSTTDTLMTNMQITPGAGSGDYLVYFSSSLSGGADTHPTFSIYVNDVQQAHTQRELFEENSIPNTEFMMGVVAGVAWTTGTIEIRWYDQSASGTIQA